MLYMDFCFNFSGDKSQIVVINSGVDKREKRKLGDINIKKTQEYKYLGVTLNENGCKRAKCGKAKFRKSKPMVWSISKCSKV